jgi:putative endonuclease
MTCWVYVLRDANGHCYTGITTRLGARITEHNGGRTRADRGRGPFRLIHKEEHPDHATARQREKYFKSGAGREWLKRHADPDR